MSEWQPARFIPTHGNGLAEPKVLERAKKLIIRVRPWNGLPPFYPRCPEVIGKLYEVHPEDVERTYGHPESTAVICEHEILTD